VSSLFHDLRNSSYYIFWEEFLPKITRHRLLPKTTTTQTTTTTTMTTTTTTMTTTTTTMVPTATTTTTTTTTTSNTNMPLGKGFKVSKSTYFDILSKASAYYLVSQRKGNTFFSFPWISVGKVLLEIKRVNQTVKVEKLSESFDISHLLPTCIIKELKEMDKPE